MLLSGFPCLPVSLRGSVAGFSVPEGPGSPYDLLLRRTGAADSDDPVLTDPVSSRYS